MPDIVTHHYFARKTLELLPKKIREKLNLDLYNFASGGPDPFFFIAFLNPKKSARALSFGGKMHRENTKMFFAEMIKITKEDKKLFSYLAGFTTHYYLDSTIHPYVYHITGEYRKDDNTTLEYRGLHTKLERAIDSYFIRYYYNREPHKFKIHKEILKLKKLDITLKESFDKLYFNVYGLKEGFQYVNKAIKYQRRFYFLIFDRFGLKNKLLSIIDNNKIRIDLKNLTYYKKEINDLDIFNKNKNRWRNPVDNKIISNDSFFELFKAAKEKSLSAIKTIYDYIYNNEAFIIEEYFNNLSYITGLDCEDKRPLKHFNNIFN